MLMRIHWSTARIFLLSLIVLCLAVCAAAAVSNGTETIITTDTQGSLQQNPAIDTTRIVWDDQRSGWEMNTIYSYDLATGKEYQVLPDPTDPNLWQTAPSVRGDWIVWQQDGSSGYAIVAFNNATLETFSIPAVPLDTGGSSYRFEPSDNVLPRTNGTVVIWQDYTNNPAWGIFLYDLCQGPSGVPDPVLANPAFDQKKPDISGDYIVYENWSGGQSDIYLYFGSNHTAVQISTFSNDDLNPSVEGTRIVWQRTNETTGYNAVYLYDLATGETRQLTPPGAVFNQVNPRISGTIVVVQDDRMGGAAQVYAYRLTASSPTEQWITSGSASMKINPAVSGNRVVWEDYRNGIGDESDIYLNTLDSSEICPVADFTLHPAAVLQGEPVTFSGSSAGSVTHRLWNFSDGSPWMLPPGSTISHSYDLNGVFPVKLTVGNLYCRNVSIPLCSHRVFVNSPPEADFNATPAYGLAPLTVRFQDTSCGTPLTWNWDFGDGNASQERNPSHIFVSRGKDHTVTLTVNNTNAGYAQSTVSKTIRTFMGAQDMARTPVNGIFFDGRFGGQYLTFDSSVLPDYSPAPPTTTLVVNPPAEYGWENITFLASDGPAFSPGTFNGTYFANISRIYLKTRDTIATTSGMTPAIGSGWGTGYQVNTTTYPASSSLKTEIWEGAVSDDRRFFNYIASHAEIPHLFRDIAYTAKITKISFTNEGVSRINMSVGSSWASSAETIYILGFGLDAEGNNIGAIIPVEHVASAGGLEYFEAEIPESAAFLSTFGLTDMTGSGNPFQLITLSVTSHVSPPAPAPPSNPPSESDAGMPAGSISPTMTTVPVPTPSPTATRDAKVTTDTGVSAKVYTNAQGTVTQATHVVSAEGRATVTISEGITAKDAAGKPLTEITLRAVPPEELPQFPPDSVVVFDGIAYEIGPDSATFSPPASLSFLPLHPQWARDYRVESYNTKSGAWENLPTTFDRSTGLVTAQFSHISIHALFTVTPAAPPAATAAPVTLTAAPQQAKAQPPSSAVSTFASMMGWAAGLVLNNLVLLVAVIVITTAVALVLEDKFPGSGR